MFFDRDWTALEVPTKWAIAQHSGRGNTVKKYSNYVLELLVHCASERKYWGDVKRVDLKCLRAKFDAEKLGTSAINGRFDAYWNFFEWAKDDGYIEKNPLPSASQKAARRSFWKREDLPGYRFIPISHLQSIISQLRTDYQLATFCACVAGLRACEIATLEWGWLPEQSETLGRFEIKIHHPLRKGGVNEPFYLQVPLLDKLWDYFNYERAEIVAKFQKLDPNYKEPSQLFISQKSGLALSPARFSKEFKSAADSSGFLKQGYVFHGCRHTFAVSMYCAFRQLQAQKVNIDAEWELSRRLGHRSKESAETYIRALLEHYDPNLEEWFRQASAAGVVIDPSRIMPGYSREPL